ncbi:hypothetical protein BD779DRAFT_781645 [Infundibulicybe gibba]|nr:hypothetical protein BD779DRAFT_781645 [Infundibulicybe gibba]
MCIGISITELIAFMGALGDYREHRPKSIDKFQFPSTKRTWDGYLPCRPPKISFVIDPGSKESVCGNGLRDVNCARRKLVDPTLCDGFYGRVRGCGGCMNDSPSGIHILVNIRVCMSQRPATRVRLSLYVPRPFPLENVLLSIEPGMCSPLHCLLIPPN